MVFKAFSLKPASTTHCNKLSVALNDVGEVQCFFTLKYNQQPNRAWRHGMGTSTQTQTHHSVHISLTYTHITPPPPHTHIPTHHTHTHTDTHMCIDITHTHTHTHTHCEWCCHAAHTPSMVQNLMRMH